MLKLKILRWNFDLNLWLTIKLLVSFTFYSLTIFCSFKVQLYVCCQHVIMCVLVCIFIFGVKAVTRHCTRIRVDFFLSMTFCVNHISYPCALILHVFCNTFCIPFIKEKLQCSQYFFSSLFTENLAHWDYVSDF